VTASVPPRDPNAKEGVFVLEIKVERFADVLVVSAGGRIDYQNAEAFKSALMPHVENCRAGGDLVVLDLSELEYVSSAGLRVLMIAAKESKARNGKLLAVALQPVVREIFEISRFDMVFEIFDSARDALAKTSPKALAAYEAR
jgi:anti-sigma B factor antagonist